jgi:hypothetical protein
MNLCTKKLSIYKGRKMPGRFSGKNVFVTISGIQKEFGTDAGDKLVCSVFEDEQSEAPRWVWEKSGELNEHLHVVYTLKKSVQFRRTAFEDVLDAFGTGCLNIQTWSRRSTYAHSLSGKKHRGKPDLWLFEKMYYCDLPGHEDYFDAEKLAKKKPTVVRVGNTAKTALYNKLKATYDAWVSADNSVAEKSDKPKDFIYQKVFDGMTQDELDEFIDDSSQPFKVRMWALENYDKVVKSIDTIDTIQTRKRMKALYSDRAKDYRPFQTGLSEILDSQNDRNIHVHCDDGNTGKNRFCETENLREDTCVVQSACTKDIAFVWNPKKHKRIIVDVPRGKMQYLNTSALEKLKNGQIMSTKYVPKFKQSEFKPSIVILGNERLERDTWTGDRLTESTTSRRANYELREHEPLSAYDMMTSAQQVEEVYIEDL